MSGSAKTPESTNDGRRRGVLSRSAMRADENAGELVSTKTWHDTDTTRSYGISRFSLAPSSVLSPVFDTVDEQSGGRVVKYWLSVSFPADPEFSLSAYRDYQEPRTDMSLRQDTMASLRPCHAYHCQRQGRVCGTAA